MPSIFIANATRQQRRFFYRFDMSADGIKQDKTPPKHIDIGSGKQVRLDLQPTQPGVLIRQLETAGGRSVAERNRLGDETIPYVYNLDHPVPPPVIEAVHDHNNSVHKARAKKRREHGAIVASQQVQEAVEATMVKFKADGNIPKARLFEAEIEMIDQGDAPLEGSPVAVGLRVDIGADRSRNAG